MIKGKKGKKREKRKKMGKSGGLEDGERVGAEWCGVAQSVVEEEGQVGYALIVLILEQMPSRCYLSGSSSPSELGLGRFFLWCFHQRIGDIRIHRVLAFPRNEPEKEGAQSASRHNGGSSV